MEMESSCNTNKAKTKKKRPQRPFDFSKYSRRHVALQFVYLGWEYHGFAVQDTTDKTIEAALFPSLIRTRLIESRETSNYHRCGRTDKGVSAFGQVISISLRSVLCCGQGLTKPGEIVQSESKCACGNNCDDSKELPYTRMLNRTLPPEIRILAWSPVPVGFSSRFDCTSRTYHYTFPAPNNQICLDSLKEGAAKLLGDHDFRNFCRADSARAGQSFHRTVLSTGLTETPSHSPVQPTFAKFRITGSSFLWHQVRCMMTVLMAIGRKEEESQLIETMFDPEKTPEKPSYGLAADFPLVLSHCGFDNHNLNWHEDKEELEKIAEHFEKIWAKFAVQTSMLSDLVTNIRDRSDSTPMLWSGSLKAFVSSSQPRLINHHHNLRKKRPCDTKEPDPNPAKLPKS